MLGRAALVLGSVLLCGAGACALTTPDLGAPLRELRDQQRRQAQRVATAFCAAYYDCGCEQEFPPHEDEAECVEYLAESLLQRLEQGINAELDYDPECLDATAELVEAIGCATVDQIPTDATLERLLDEASWCRTYNGELALDEECTPLLSARGGECAPGLACDLDFQMCFDITPLAEGAPCDWDGEPCDTGLWCDWSSAAQQTVCVRPVEPGASCLDSGFCTLDAWCDPTTSVCALLPDLGQPCEASVEQGCRWGLRCEQGTCVARATEGEPCQSGCGPGLVCGEDQRCEPRAALICDLEADLP